MRKILAALLLRAAVIADGELVAKWMVDTFASTPPDNFLGRVRARGEQLGAQMEELTDIASQLSDRLRTGIRTGKHSDLSDLKKRLGLNTSKSKSEPN